LKPPFFSGSHRLNVDDKNRLFLPQTVREAIDPATHGDALYIAITRHALLIYPDKYYEDLANRLFPPDITPDEDLLLYKQQMFGALSKASYDKQGRLSVPEFALQRAGIQREVALVGMQDHLELWNRPDWDKRLDELLQRGPQIEIKGKEALKRLQKENLESKQ
jgi:MraZ protein